MTEWVVLDYRDYWGRIAKPASPSPKPSGEIYDCGWYRFHAASPPVVAVAPASTVSTATVAHELHEVWVDVAPSTDSLEQGETFAEGRDIEEANPRDESRVGQKRTEQRQWCLPPVFIWILSHLF